MHAVAFFSCVHGSPAPGFVDLSLSGCLVRRLDIIIATTEQGVCVAVTYVACAYVDKTSGEYLCVLSDPPELRGVSDRATARWLQMRYTTK